MIDDERDDFDSPAGPGRFMGLFFGAAVLCALFFGLGYRMGKSSAAGTPGVAVATQDDPKSSAVSGAPKPSAARDESPSDESAASKDLTFYKSVQNKQADAKLSPNSASEPKPKPAQAVAPARSAPEMSRAPGGNYIVQVAAVSKQDDAEALLGALRKKNYPVFVVSNPPGDKLFHVQVGPFATVADAEQMRSRLSSDGYNPILKK